ncbi:MAG: HAMP domain-containing histidine kinase [Oscillospiraceae bacterium]|nr:HAMP domain-containing histidine kinase [Oscillospiraceae bacterium]
MNRLKGSLFAKTLAVILFCALCLSFASSALAVGLLYTADYYGRGTDTARERLAQSLCADEGQRIAWLDPVNGAEESTELPSYGNFRYEVFDVNGVLRLSNYEGEATLGSSVHSCGFWYSFSEHAYGTLWGEEADTAQPVPAQTDGETAQTDTQAEEPSGVSQPAQFEKPLPSAEVTPTPRPAVPGDIYDEPRGRVVNYTVVCYLLRDMTEEDGARFQMRSLDFAAANSRMLALTAGASALLALLIFIFLLRAAGHRRDTDEIRASFVEKIPFDLFTALVAFAGIGVLFVFVDSVDYLSLSHSVAFHLGVAAVMFVLGTLLFLLWCMSLAVRVKQKTLIRGTILYKLLRLIWRAAKALWGWLKMILTGIPLVWRGLLILCGAEFIGLLVFAASPRRSGPAGLLINLFLFFPLALWALISARKLRMGASEIAKGNTAYRIDTKYLFGEFRRHADDLNAIQSGISRAVEERLRSERMKTELITNVSHDIKTPLTSIVSYVDLLSKEEIDNEKAKEYIEVLQRQSARLKKLTDDLVEASKASSGALGVTIENCSLSVMLEQAAGEYGEKLAERGLELVLRKPEKEVMARADARHTQRIFDNLMNNILKYALPGTRVYLELTEGESGPAVIFRNTSRSEIVQSPEELTERFVRGDASRSSEGSGLGLSIARSLAELQGGSLAVTVDGDLFKVTLCFAG